MVYIDSAYFGDEKSFRNITKSILGKLSGDTIDVVANETLIPAFEVSEKTELDDLEQRRIREEAVKACGGEANQECLERTRLKLNQEALLEKEKEVERKNVIKGRRLTVNIIDNEGKRKQVIVPDGQQFTLSGVTSINPGEKGLGVPSRSEVEKKMWDVIGMVAYAFVYVFGVVMTYTVFMRRAEEMFAIKQIGKGYMFQSIAYGTFFFTLLLALLGSPSYGWMVGYIVVLLYFGFNAFIDTFIKET
jgi:hypothetical protein